MSSPAPAILLDATRQAVKTGSKRLRAALDRTFSARNLSRREWDRRTSLLEKAGHPLKEFSRLSDREFAELAKSLSAYRTQTEVLLEASSTFKHFFEGDAEENAIRRAVNLGKHAIELVHSSIGVGYALRHQFDQVSITLDEALAARAQFENNMIIFRTLAIGFRIEAARCEEVHRGIFSAVANDFTTLESQVAKTTANAFEEIERLTRATRGDGDPDRSDGEASQRASAERVERLRDQLADIEAALAPCAEQARQTGDLLNTLPGHMMAVVRHLQYQDIVRQKTEHIEEGLEALRAPRNRSSHLFAHIANLQLAQLSQARDQIGQAGEALLQGTQTIMRVGQETAERIHSLERAVLRDLGTREFARHFAEDLTHLTNVAQTTEATHRRIAAHVDQVERVITYFTKEISVQQNSVRLTALNAQIAAARLDNGGALEKLAQETNLIANANSRATEELRQKLIKTLEILQQVREEAARSLTLLSNEKDTLVQGARTIQGEIETYAGAIEANAKEITHAFGHAHRVLVELHRSVTFPRHLDRCFRPLEEALTAFAAEAEGAPSAEALKACPHAAALLSHHSSRYTMEEERVTHREVVGAGGSAALEVPEFDEPSDLAPSETTLKDPSTGSDDDDGIELF
jgi:hypothetical protein